MGARFQADRPPATRRDRRASVAAIAMGACVIEKHFTLARADGGPDADFSLEPAEFAALVRDCRDAWTALGAVNYDLLGSERINATFRRSLYVAADVKAGEPLSRANVAAFDPARAQACRPPTSTPCWAARPPATYDARRAASRLGHGRRG